MNKNETLKLLNKKIDKLIIEGKEHTDQFKKLCRLHSNLIHN